METESNTGPMIYAATLRNPVEDWLRDSFTPNGTAGVPVNAQTVRGLPGAWYSICKIAGHIGTLPLHCYRRIEEDSELARNHPADYLIRKRPNSFCSPSVFRETLQHHALLYGNGRAAIVRNGRGDPSELIIMNPAKWAIVVTDPVEIGGVMAPQVKYHVRIDDPRVRIKDENVLHIMGLSDDGISGINVIDAAKQSLGIAIAQQTRRVSGEKNGAKVSFLLSAPPGAFRSAAEAQTFIDSFNAYHSGSDNVDRVGLLREGITAQSIGQNSQQAQELEKAMFSRQDQALLFAIESILGDNSSQSYNSLEQKNRAYLTGCLQRWITRWEEECGIKLLTTYQYDFDEYYFRFVVEGLLRGTTKERYEVYQIARQIGVMNANEIRELEDMNERTDEGGDLYDNPAITPGTAVAPPETSTEDDTGDETIDTPALARLRTAIAGSVRGLVQVEHARVLKASTSQSNFVSWLDEFYAGWAPKVQELADNFQGPQTIGAEWCQQSKAALLNVAGSSDARGLGEAVRKDLATWDAKRIEPLIESIMKG